MPRIKVEICVSDVASALAAQSGGADRVELCENLAVGGTTPSRGAIAFAVEHLTIPVHVMIRARGGDFVVSAVDSAVMARDIQTVKDLGAAGIVLGALLPDGTIDKPSLERMIVFARPLSVTFHKAFDQTPDPLRALDELIELGVDRVLTSGGCPCAREGAQLLAQLVSRSRGRIAIMAGGGLTIEDLEPMVANAGLGELHFGSAAAVLEPSRMKGPARDGSDGSWSRVDPRKVAAIVARLEALGQ